MILERSMSRAWLSNSYLVADEPGGHAVIVDTGGPTAPILQSIERLGLEVTHVLCTHHHADHVEHNREYRDRFGCPVCGPARERDLFESLDVELSGGETLDSGGLRIRVLHTPGHTRGMLAFVVDDRGVFTGDTLFRGSVGGTRAAGHATFEDLRRSVMDVLMALPREMTVHPGHTESTTIAREWEANPFIRMWRGLDEPGTGRCLAFGRPATLLLSARDYDGGRKCWVRFDAGGELDVVPGSQVSSQGV
jgi:hydroxyacylglutathione hydrolase